MILAKLKAEPIEHHNLHLLLCPFCGGDAQVMSTTRGSGLLTFYVRCKQCRASSDLAHRPELAGEKWNKRTP